eukprot:TRINITY_DN92976_c0_g1_i1.p1 TRINITY_DN92976_c0_g1~~TRINITY_DN92976_c0_g1_i1.p1  ORF type:complete len:394 (+),score=20.47 TRINITY_DN92976_c0_g1_i1:107-1288(+)
MSSMLRKVQLAWGSAAGCVLGLQMGIHDLLAYSLAGHCRSTRSLVQVGFGCCLCCCCSASALSPESFRMRWLTLRMVCLRSCTASFRLTSLRKYPAFYMGVVLVHVLAVLALVSPDLKPLERGVQACVMVVCGVVAVAGRLDFTYGTTAFLQASALLEAFLALALAVGRLCSKRSQGAEVVPTDSFAAAMPTESTGGAPDQAPAITSFARAETVGRPEDSHSSVLSQAGSTDDILSFCSPLCSDVSDKSQRLDSTVVEVFAMGTLQSLAARALLNSVSYPGDGTHTLLYMTTTTAVQSGVTGSCNAAKRDWVQFLEGVWQVDDCCAGCAPPWAFSLEFRDGTVMYNSGCQGNLTLRDCRWHLEGAPLVWISDALIARYSPAGDHLVWHRQPTA